MSDPTSTDTSVTLDSTFKAIQYWRANKDKFEGVGMPDSIWQQIFSLEKTGFQVKELRSIFTLTHDQYSKKRRQLYPEPDTPQTTAPQSSQAEPTEPPTFVEAVAKPDPVPALSPRTQKTKAAVKTLKSTTNKPEDYLDTSTVIVECIRADGQRLKIHTVAGRLGEVMQAFYQNGHDE